MIYPFGIGTTLYFESFIRKILDIASIVLKEKIYLYNIVMAYSKKKKNGIIIKFKRNTLSKRKLLRGGVNNPSTITNNNNQNIQPGSTPIIEGKYQLILYSEKFDSVQYIEQDNIDINKPISYYLNASPKTQRIYDVKNKTERICGLQKVYKGVEGTAGLIYKNIGKADLSRRLDMTKSKYDKVNYNNTLIKEYGEEFTNSYEKTKNIINEGGQNKEDIKSLKNEFEKKMIYNLNRIIGEVIKNVMFLKQTFSTKDTTYYEEQLNELNKLRGSDSEQKENYLKDIKNKINSIKDIKDIKDIEYIKQLQIDIYNIYKETTEINKETTKYIPGETNKYISSSNTINSSI
jgi:hypothetical protein